MTYYQDIQNNLKSHVRNLESIGEKEKLPKNVVSHLEKTNHILKIIDGQQPENYKQLIEYLNQEGRNFGWSFPKNTEEEKCETDFWKLKDSMKSIIQGMTVNERLYFFGYLDEYEGLRTIQRSAREEIELKLFIK
tara:strand:+ start:61 stop:465 length:405 start_codon:yes stop_codon:yes gene_type:complete